jgi:DNA-binding PadR family transcriptional regulator
MTNAELAVLSLVAEQPRHGYEIEQVIERRGMREWTDVGFSSIYYLLKKLEREGLVEGRLQEAERGPARKVYRVTSAGRDALRGGVLGVLSVPQPCHSPLQLGLSNLPILAQGGALSALRRYRAALAGRLEHVEANRERQRPLPYFVDAMFSHSLALIRAELEWMERFVAEMEERDA